MTGRILCAVNDSSHAQRALDVAIEIAHGCAIPLVLVIVNEPLTGSQWFRYSDDDIKGILDRATSKAKAAGIKDVKRAVFESDDVAKAIVTCAKGVDAAHIVVGTGNPSLIGRLLIGSVSESILRTAECTVTLAR